MPAKWGIQSELGRISLLKLKSQFKSQQGKLGDRLERYLERRRLERGQNLNVRAKSDSILNPDVKVEINTIHNIQRRKSSIDEFKLKTRLSNHEIFKKILKCIKNSTKGYPRQGIIQTPKIMGGISQRDLPTMLRELTNGERILLELLQRLMIQDILITEDVVYGVLDQLNVKNDLLNTHLIPTIQTLFQCFAKSEYDENDDNQDEISIGCFLNRLKNHKDVVNNTKLYNEIVQKYRLSNEEAILESQASTRETFRIKKLKSAGYSTLKPELRQRRGGRLSVSNQLSKF